MVNRVYAGSYGCSGRSRELAQRLSELESAQPLGESAMGLARLTAVPESLRVGFPKISCVREC